MPMHHVSSPTSLENVHFLVGSALDLPVEHNLLSMLAIVPKMLLEMLCTVHRHELLTRIMEDCE